MNSDKSEYQYEVLSPWGEVDPVILRAISPRLTGLAGKRIGLFNNLKRAARPILTTIEEQLKQKFPTCETSWYIPASLNPPEIETERKNAFESWLRRLDAVICAVGD